MHCADLNLTKGLQVDNYSTKLGSRITFSCEQGNVLVGATHIRCKASGNWSAPFPECQS